MGKCAICGSSETGLKAHLIQTHKVENTEELGLLLSLSRHHFKGTLNCDLCDRRKLTHLDRHFASVHSLQRADITERVKAAKEARLLHLLRELRASRPGPSLVSEPDTDPAGRPESDQPTPASPAPSRHTDVELTENDTPVEGPPPKGSQPSHTPSHDTDSELTVSDASVEVTPKKWKKLRLTRCFRKSPVFAAISDYQEFNTTTYASPKDVENSAMRKNHAIHYVLHMFSHSESASLENCAFLDHCGNMRGWQASLVNQQYAVTSVNIMIGNAAAFVRHLRAFHSEMAGLSASQFDRIDLQFKRMRRDNGRRIRAHQQTVRREKSNELQTRSGGRSLDLVHGYIAGYFAIVSGHRPIVFLNLRKAHLDQADVDSRKRALVWVDKHKTDRTFGGACLALDQREVAWLHRLDQVSNQSGGDRYIFRSGGKPLTNITKQLQRAWEDSRLGARITFQLIRTAIANQTHEDIQPAALFSDTRSLGSLSQAKKNLSDGDRKLVCEAMCHGVSTADRFYTAVPGVSDMFRLRDLRINALEKEGLEPETTTDSGEHQIPTPDSN
ncbi:hypothetical protein SRHO_G00113270 [Serrasalmus rhombeus]